jgi:hypothetical protein
VRFLSLKEQSYKLVIKDNLKIKRKERREEKSLKTLILVLIRLLIQRGSVFKVKLRMAK